MRKMLLSLLLVPALASAEPLWLRNAALSPDGQQLAFTYQGRIYLSDTQGNSAVPLTDGSFFPHKLIWSPDNQTLAFAANIYGSDDVFTLSLESGKLGRITAHAGTDIPAGFSADGSQLYFSTTRVTAQKQDFYSVAPYSYGQPGNQLYRFDLNSGEARVAFALPVRNLSWSDTGLLYNSPHKDQVYRKHQHSFAVPNIWFFDPESGEHRQLTENRVAAQNPHWFRDGFFYLSERSGSFNVWYRDKQGENQLTDFTGLPVRDLSVADNGTLAFSFDGELYTLKPGDEKPVKVAMKLRHFAPGKSQRFTTSQADQLAIKNQDEALLTSFGDIYALGGKDFTSRNLTSTASEEKDAIYTHDGTAVIYASLRDSRWGLYQTRSVVEDEPLSAAPVVEETPLLLVPDHDVSLPSLSPDGKYLAFVIDGRALHIVETEELSSGKPDWKLSEDAGLLEIIGVNQKLGKPLLPADNFSDAGSVLYSWSPDSAQIAVRTNPGPYHTEVLVSDLKGNLSVVSQSGFSKGSPKWSSDNRILMWETSRFGLKTADGSDWTTTIVGVFTSAEAKRDFDDGAELPEEGVKSYPFEEQGSEYRQAFSLPVSGLIQDYHLNGDLLFVVAEDNTPSGEQSSEIYQYNIHDQESLSLYQNIAPAELISFQEEHGRVTILGGGELHHFSLSDDYSEQNGVTLDVTYNDKQRREAMYQQLTKQVAQHFYDPEMNGVDWQALTRRYARSLPQINNNADFAILLRELLGELNVSHTGAYGYDQFGMRYEQSASLGLVFAANQKGNDDASLSVAELLPGGAAQGLDIQPDDLLVKINDQEVSSLLQLNQALTEQAEKETELTFERGGEPHYVRITPGYSEEDDALMQKRWAIARRDYVSEKTNGEVGYVYLPEMSNDAFIHLRSEALGRFRNAKVLLVDVRFNGGGFLADTLIDFLTAQAAADVVPKAGQAQADAAGRRWLKPSLLLTNASAYSEGSAFGQYYRDLGVGPVVGEPVPGTGTAVMDITSRIYPDVSFRFPFLPLKDRDGNYYENLELIPDVEAFNSPEQVESGVDHQLDIAIEQALALTAEKKAK